MESMPNKEGPKECVICREELKNPKYLPCGHEYCGPPKTCLEDLEAQLGTLRCPECDEEFQFTAEEFQNMHLTKEEVERLSRVDLWTKEFCQKHQQWMIWFCHDCQDKVCKKCWREEHMQDYHHDVEFLEFVNQKFFLDKIKLFKIEGRKALLEFLQAVIDKMLAQLHLYTEKFDEEIEHLQEAEGAARNLPTSSSGQQQAPAPYDQIFDENHPEVVAYLKIHAEQGIRLARKTCFRKSDEKNLQKVADYLPLLYGKGCKFAL